MTGVNNYWEKTSHAHSQIITFRAIRTDFHWHLSPYSPPSPGSLRLRSPCVFIHYPINTPNHLVLGRGSEIFFSQLLSWLLWELAISLLQTLASQCSALLRVSQNEPLCLGCSLVAQRVLPHASDLMSNNSSQMSYLNTSSSALLFNLIGNSHFHLLTCLLSGSPYHSVGSKQAEAGTASLASHCLHCAWHSADLN